MGKNRANIPTQEYEETYFEPPSSASAMETPPEETSPTE
jgi:hypothetical protein